ncbi:MULTISPECIES: hypothetical protein [Rhizobium]|uniref:Uncharacterized protein n=1 Tax=Rhizobium tumorigenes TaxID=2041385 RepID=A0AAF1K8N8_9HYPH|nr:MULTISPECIES: hypothetical protein [Rhizobium]WFR98203.1 hypothetical protein PR017_22845 [Rhizobium tumorigenes]WFS03715.1 hypothetical protein PR016_23275 [Rhizobium tumorigenes]
MYSLAMKKHSTLSSQVIQPSKLTSSRGEKISAVEGMNLSPRMRAILAQSQGKSGDERRALVRAQFTKIKV